jgi:adenylosuccinate synthase
MSNTLSVVVGGAFGSEAKGAVTARLARKALDKGENVNVIRVAGHNAGHTAYDGQGRPWALRTIPAAAVVDPSIGLWIAAGSEVNPDVLMHEVIMLEDAGIPVRDRLFVDTSATWLEDKHIETEGGLKLHERTGSTGKGVGAARADRIMRVARTIGEWDELEKWCVPTENTGRILRTMGVYDGVHFILEGTQGYGLGVHTSFYPLTTSSDCRAIDFLAMAGLDPTAFENYDVWVVLRRFPIRVAGPSGELKNETTWEELGLPEERTTVTKKVRRVGDWDGDLAAEAVEANGGRRVVKIAFTMADQDIHAVAGLDGDLFSAGEHLAAEEYQALKSLVRMVESDAGAPVKLIGTGPNSMLEV